MTGLPTFPCRRAILLAAGTILAAIVPLGGASAGGWHHGWGGGPRFGFYFGGPGYYGPPAYYYPPPAYYPPPVYYAPPAYYPPAPAMAAPPAPPQDFTVYFDFDRRSLTADGARVVDQAIAQVQRSGPSQIQVGGYTDAAGTDSYNYALAQGRAAAVRNYMIGRGVPADQIVIRSFGKNDPRVPTPNGVREAQNRRVEIMISPAPNVSYAPPPPPGYGNSGG
jgi:OmpA-OmpF porin, OOP family